MLLNYTLRCKLLGYKEILSKNSKYNNGNFIFLKEWLTMIYFSLKKDI